MFCNDSKIYCNYTTKSRKLKTVFHFCSSKVEDLPFSTPRVHVSNVGVFLNFHDDDYIAYETQSFFFQTFLHCYVGANWSIVKFFKKYSTAVDFFFSIMLYACQLNKRNSIISNDNLKISLTMTVSFVYQETKKKYFLNRKFNLKITW